MHVNAENNTFTAAEWGGRSLKFTIKLIIVSLIMVRQITAPIKHQFNPILILSFFILLSGCFNAAGATIINMSDTINLWGKWRFQTDPDDVGVREAWFKKQLTGTISLPG